MTRPAPGLAHPAGSAKLIKDKQLSEAAAIASERAATVFGLQVLESGIQDFADNITRFIIVSGVAEDDRAAGANGMVDGHGLLLVERCACRIAASDAVIRT